VFDDELLPLDQLPDRPERAERQAGCFRRCSTVRGGAFRLTGGQTGRLENVVAWYSANMPVPITTSPMAFDRFKGEEASCSLIEDLQRWRFDSWVLD
jgi:hypothetical protein